jgi:hypothetical protein
MPDGLSLGPRSVERPSDAGFTFVATLDSQEPARVDVGGLVQPFQTPWSIDWLVRADDRWYVPAKEPSVRQRRIGAGAVLETAVRIPSGDAIQRVYSVNAPGGDAIVIEIENSSPVPVALAVALRPYDLSGTTRPASIEISDERIVVDGRAALIMPRPPIERQASSGMDVVGRLVAGNVLNGDAESSGDLATCAVVYPLAHGATMRFVVPHPSAPARMGPVPDADAVARGWSAVIEKGGRFSFPDPGITQQAMAARARLLAETPALPARVSELERGAGRLLEALALSGAVGEIMGSLGALAGTFPTKLPGDPADAAAIISGVGRAARLVDDLAVAEALLEPVAQLTYLVEKKGTVSDTNEALMGLSRLLIAAGQRNVAEELLPRIADPNALAGVPNTIEELSVLAEQASPAGSWGADDVVRAAEFWLGARNLVLGGDPRHLALLPKFPGAWMGGEVEIHNAATTHGRISFAIRWHGARPALLWDLEHDDDPGVAPIEIRCPGLDPDWSTTEKQGDALLAGTPDGLVAPPSEGDSFV